MPKEKALQGSIQEKNGKYYAVIGYNDVITRKRKMKWIGLGMDTSDRKADINKAFREAVRKFEQEYKRMCEGMSSPDEYPLVAFLNDWLDKVKIRSVQKSTFHGYKSLVNGKIARFFGDKFTLGDLNIRTVTAFYETFREKNRSESTILRYHNLLHEACKYAVRQEILDSNPMDKVDRPKQKKYRGNYYSPEKVQTLLSMIKDDVIYMPVLLAAYYGLRRSEAVGLSWSNVDFENGVIHVAQKVIELTENGKTELIISKDMKNESSRRSLPLISDVKKILLEQKEKQETYRKMFRKDYNRKYLDMICVDPMGNLIHPDRITEHFPVLLERFGMEKIRFHDLRHSCASMLIANHASLKEVQMWLGHSTITTTADVSGHLDESAKNRIGDAMQKLLCPDEGEDD